jgi:dynein light chain LC8-type
MSEQRRAVVKNADMSDEMQQDAVDCATAALSKYGIEKDVAAHIKKEFDKKYHPTWHCIVGRNFGATPRFFSCFCRHSLFHQPFTDICCLWFALSTPGSYVTHETKHFIYFYLGQVAILLFKSG